MAGGREAASPVGVWSDLTRSGPEAGPRGVRPPDPPPGGPCRGPGQGQAAAREPAPRAAEWRWTRQDWSRLEWVSGDSACPQVLVQVTWESTDAGQLIGGQEPCTGRGLLLGSQPWGRRGSGGPGGQSWGGGWSEQAPLPRAACVLGRAGTSELGRASHPGWSRRVWGPGGRRGEAGGTLWPPGSRTEHVGATWGSGTINPGGGGG